MKSIAFQGRHGQSITQEYYTHDIGLTGVDPSPDQKLQNPERDQEQEEPDDNSTTSEDTEDTGTDTEDEESLPNPEEVAELQTPGDVGDDPNIIQDDEEPEPIDLQEPGPIDLQEEDQDPQEPTEEPPQPTRTSGRIRTPAQNLNVSSMSGKSYVQAATPALLEHNHNIIHQTAQKVEYTETEAQVMGMIIGTLREYCFAQQYLVNKGLKIFGKRGRAAVIKEMKQLHDRTCFEPISIKDLTPDEKKKAMKALMFLTEKRDGSIKGRGVYNGKPTRQWLSREETASPTCSSESITLTAVIDNKEDRDVMCVDIPNAFIQTPVPKHKTNQELKQVQTEKIVMKITGVMVDILLDIAPDVYGGYVVYENGQRVIYVWVVRAIYGMLISSLLWYKKFRGDIETQGFEFNPYDACVANRMVNGHQQTIRFHVDDLMASHIDPFVNDELYHWLQKQYGDLGAVTQHRGKEHDYLGVIYRYRPDYIEMDMTDYVKKMLNEYPIKFKPGTKCTCPAKADLFEIKKSDYLNKEYKEIFHTTVAQALYLCKRARIDIQPTVVVLCTRVRNPTQHDWEALKQLMMYLHCTQDDVRRIDTRQDISIIRWMVDASFAVHDDFKSHTGAIMTFDNKKGGALQAISRKQQLNTKSSTEAEVVAVDDASTLIFWTQLFLEAQGYHIEKNIIYQDNKSAILLETNGKSSSGKRTRALNIRYS